MATVTPILRTAKKDARGCCPIWLRISDRDRTRFVSLGEKVRASQWNPRQGRVRKGHPNAGLINRLIEKKVNEAHAEILKLKLEDTYATADHLKEVLQPQAAAGDFLAFWERHLEGLQQRGQGAPSRLRFVPRHVRRKPSNSCSRSKCQHLRSPLPVAFASYPCRDKVGLLGVSL